MAFVEVSNQPLADLLRLTGKRIVVTGGGSGIGQAICRRAGEAGATVMVADLDLAYARATANSTMGNTVFADQVDTRDKQSVEDFARRAVEQMGGIDAWVNDAGIYPIKPALEISAADWANVLDTNLSGYFWGACAAARQMQNGGKGGVIINIASSLGYHAVLEQASYVATKWAVRGLTATLALEWGKGGIRVVAIGPGYTMTPGMDAVRDKLSQIAGGDAPAAYAQHMPAGRTGVPDDIARAAVFLLSDAASYVTGSTLLVDGGEVAAGGAG